MVILAQFSPRIILIIDTKGFIRLLPNHVCMYACMLWVWCDKLPLVWEDKLADDNPRPMHAVTVAILLLLFIPQKPWCA